MLSGQVFVDEGIITSEQLEQAQGLLEEAGADNIADALIEIGAISERDRVRCLGKVWGIPYVDLRERRPQPAALELLSSKQAKKFRAIPLAATSEKLFVAMANPLDVFVIDELRIVTGREIEPLITSDKEVDEALETHYQGDVDVSDALAGITQDFDATLDITSGDIDEDLSEDDLRSMGDDAPIIRLANLIINQAITDKASDIHVEPRRDCVIVRYRIDGIMYESMKLPRKVAAPLCSRLKIVANMDIAEKRAPQDNRISAVVQGKEFDFRVSTLPVVYGEKIVMRVLDKGGINVGLEKLGFLEHNFELIQDMASRSYGIILVTGPTGSGKSTTLYSLLNRINDGKNNILTIEDPVEYEVDAINQCGVNPRAGMTFAAGLRAMLRQDPDVIMVGEMRDKETATIAMEAALTGHLVLSTLHTNDAPSAPMRLTEMGVEPFLISSSIVGILAQRLVRKVCPECASQYEETTEAIRRYGFELPEGYADQETLTLVKGEGCDSCKNTGHRSRTGIHELLSMTEDIRNLILHKAPSHDIRKSAVAAGLKTLQEDAIAKVLNGTTSMEEVLRVIYG